MSSPPQPPPPPPPEPSGRKFLGVMAAFVHHRRQRVVVCADNDKGHNNDHDHDEDDDDEDDDAPDFIERHITKVDGDYGAGSDAEPRVLGNDKEDNDEEEDVGVPPPPPPESPRKVVRLSDCVVMVDAVEDDDHHDGEQGHDGQGPPPPDWRPPRPPRPPLPPGRAQERRSGGLAFLRAPRPSRAQSDQVVPPMRADNPELFSDQDQHQHQHWPPADDAAGGKAEGVWWVANHYTKRPLRARSGPAPDHLPTGVARRVQRRSSMSAVPSLGGLPLPWLQESRQAVFSSEAAEEAAQLALAEANLQTNKLDLSKAEKKKWKARLRSSSGKKQMQQAKQERHASMIYRDLHKLLEHAEGRESFVRHLEKRFCSEALLFHRAAKATVLRLENNDALGSDIVVRLFETYICDGSPMMINLQSSTKEKLTALVAELRAHQTALLQHQQDEQDEQQQEGGREEEGPQQGNGEEQGREEEGHQQGERQRQQEQGQERGGSPPPLPECTVPTAMAVQFRAAFAEANREMLSLMERSVLPEFLRSDDSFMWKETCRQAVKEFDKLHSPRSSRERRPSF